MRMSNDITIDIDTDADRVDIRFAQGSRVVRLDMPCEQARYLAAEILRGLDECGLEPS